MWESATNSGFADVIISVKSTDVRLMIEAYRLVAQRTDIPLHLGVTEAGTTRVGTIKSAVGIGTLLAEGIGDTIRVSLTDEPVKEVEVGKEILRSLGLATRNVELIACPTCGRLEVDLFGIMAELEKRLEGVKKPVKIAVLGCVVNGPGEASEADIGIAAGKGVGILYRKGEVVRKVKESEIVDVIVEEVHRIPAGDLPPCPVFSLACISSPMNILFVGDIVGTVPASIWPSRSYPDCVKKYSIDLLIVNGENVTEGKGIAEEHAKKDLRVGCACHHHRQSCVGSVGQPEGARR